MYGVRQSNGRLKLNNEYFSDFLCTYLHNSSSQHTLERMEEGGVSPYAARRGIRAQPTDARQWQNFANLLKSSGKICFAEEIDSGTSIKFSLKQSKSSGKIFFLIQQVNKSLFHIFKNQFHYFSQLGTTEVKSVKSVKSDKYFCYQLTVRYFLSDLTD